MFHDCDRTRRHERRLLVVFLVALGIWGLTDVRRRARIEEGRPEIHKTDLTVFTGAGAAFFNGGDPYEFSNPRGWKYPYPPLFAIALAPLSNLDPQLQALIWFAFSLVLAWGCWNEAFKIARTVGKHISLRISKPAANHWLAFWAVAAIALPALNCLQRGQVGILIVYLLMFGFRQVVEAKRFESVFLGSLALSLAVVIKLFPALPVAIIALMWVVSSLAQNRAAWLRACWVPGGVAFGMVLFVIVIPSIALGFSANVRHLNAFQNRVISMAVTIDPDGQVESPYTPRNQSLSNAVYRFGNWWSYAFLDGIDDRIVDRVSYQQKPSMPMDNGIVGPALLFAKCAILLLLCVTAALLAKLGDNGAMAAVFGASSVAALVVSPMSRGHYFVMLLPAQLLVPMWIDGAGRPGLARATAATAAVLVVLHYLFLRTAGRIGLLGLGITGWLVIGLLIMLSCRGKASAGARGSSVDDNRLLRAA